jgi:hypothetical protein
LRCRRLRPFGRGAAGRAGSTPPRR